MYAKRTCSPRIGDEATEELTKFYIHLRQTNLRSNGCNPVTMRQLESLARLTQARAKCDLRPECSGDDAKEVIEIMKASMVDYYENELGILDMTSAGFSGSQCMPPSLMQGSKSQRIKVFVSCLQKIAQNRENNLFNVNEIKDLYNKMNFTAKGISSHIELIEMLNTYSFILKKGSSYSVSNA
jgi:DNA helicase MCM8